MFTHEVVRYIISTMNPKKVTTRSRRTPRLKITFREWPSKYHPKKNKKYTIYNHSG